MIIFSSGLILGSLGMLIGMCIGGNFATSVQYVPESCSWRQK